MDYHAEPLPPGILPNFPPNYPHQWRNKLLPDPHPNELRSLGLPTAFSSYGRPQKGYGGYANCRGFDMADQNELDNQQLEMQEDYWEELMLQQNRARELGQHYINGPPQGHFSDHSWQPQWDRRQTQQWCSSKPQGHYSNLEFDDAHSKRREHWFRGQKYNSRGGRSRNVGHSSQMKVRPPQKCDAHLASKSASTGEIFMPPGNDYGCEPAEEEVAFQQSMLWYSDEYAAFDDDPDWGCNDEANAFGCSSSQFPLSAPVPSSIDHYYNLAPQKQVEKKKNNSSSVENRKLAIERKLNYLRRRFRERVCETCVVGFPRMEQYNKHLRSHVKCIYPGCKFESSIEVLDGHITREHLLNPAVNAPIDDEEYRRQRRNKFPTQAKKELQQAMFELQKKRGELLGTKPNKTKNSKDGADAGKSERGKKRLPPPDGQLKKSRVEKPVKIIRMEQNPHETYDNFIVYSRIPEFRGTDAFDEEMGVTSCFADTIKNGEVLLADVPAFHISDDEDDMYLASQKGKEIFSSSLQEKPSSGFSEDEGGMTENGGNLNAVHDLLPGAHPACVSGKAGVAALENTILEVDPPSCKGALGMLIGDYGSVSESEDETTEETKLNSSLPVKSSVFSDMGESILNQCGRKMNSAVEKDSSYEMSGDDSTKLGDEVNNAGIQPNMGKKNQRRRGKRGIKKRHSSGIVKSDDSVVESSMASSLNSKCVDVKRSSEGTSISALHASKSFMASTSYYVTETQPSLFPHLKAINSRRDSDSGDDDDEGDAILVTKPWHVRSEEALAARCVSIKYKKFRNKYKTSLLEKLLKNEVRYERNVLLQCAKYIVEHDFFDGITENKNCKEEQAQEEDENSSGSSSDDKRRQL